MTDYSSIGLDAQLRPLTSLSNQGGFVSAYDFNSLYDRNAVSVYNIKNFNFSAGTGGTLTLGGLSNGNGILQVKDSGGTQRVLLNNEGITVNDGSIVIKNALGSVVVNETGLTTYNFKSDGTSRTNVVSTSGTAYGTLDDMTLDFELNKEANVLFLASTMARNALGTTTTYFAINLLKSTDGTTYTSARTSQQWYIYEDTGEQFVNKFQSGMLLYGADGSGSYNYWRANIEWYVTAGTASCYNRQLNYVVLGY